MYEDFKWLPVRHEDAVMVDWDEWEDLDQYKWHRNTGRGAGPEGQIYSYQGGRQRTLGQHLLRSRARGKMVMHKNGNRQDFRKANLEAVERGLHFVHGMEGDPHENLSEFAKQVNKGRVLSGTASKGGKTTAALHRKKAASSGKMAGVRPIPNDSGTPRYGVRMMVTLPGEGGKQKSFGSYASPEEAGRAYDWLLSQLSLESVNFPQETPRAPAKAEQYRKLLGLSPITDTDVLSSE